MVKDCTEFELKYREEWNKDYAEKEGITNDLIDKEDMNGIFLDMERSGIVQAGDKRIGYIIGQAWSKYSTALLNGVNPPSTLELGEIKKEFMHKVGMEVTFDEKFQVKERGWAIEAQSIVDELGG